MMPESDRTGAEEQGCCRGQEGGGRSRDHAEGGHCCGGRHGHDDVALPREEEIAVLERQIADSQARLEQLRRN